MILTCLSVISETGVPKLKPNRFPTSLSIADLNVAKYPDHGFTAPSRMLLDLSGIIRSGSNSILIPKPLHCLHAPKGELKEKLLGSRSPRLIPHLEQAFR